MDFATSQLYSSLFWAVSIIVYGIFEYQRREQNHRMTLLALKYGKEPPSFEPKPQIWKLFTTGFVVLILLAASIGLIVWSRHIIHGGWTLYILAGLFLAIFAPLAYVLVRDIQAYRNLHKSKGE